MIWHQSLLVFAQRYKLELDDSQRTRLRDLLRVRAHPLITPEIRRELFGREQQVRGLRDGAEAMDVEDGGASYASGLAR